MLPDARDYATLIRDFRWAVPPRFNIGVACCDAWAAREPQRAAILTAHADGRVAATSYATLRQRSNQLANTLTRQGVTLGDRVAILLPQTEELALAHLAAYKLGAIALPLASLFGPDALEHRLKDAAAKAVVTNAAGAAKIAAIRATLPGLGAVFSIDGADAALGVLDFHREIARDSDAFTPCDTAADDPALIIYTSGTTGPPKGALHGHRVMLGHLPGVEMALEFLPQPDDVLWTPADWAWAGGLLNILLPGLYLGVPVVARKFERFDPDAAIDLMSRLKVRTGFLPPTALRMLRAAAPRLLREKVRLRSLLSGGESLGAATLAWGKEELGISINEAYGQSECNLVVSSCAAIGVLKPGFIGRPVPGHEVGVIRPDGNLCAPDEQGQIAIRRPDPVMFLGYWNNEKATQAKFIGDWMTTGDEGHADAEGYIRFTGRGDDVITSSGYRIGPGEIEDCLARHPAVAMAAAIGKPDPLRTEIIKAFVVLAPGHEASEALAADISAFVRARLSAHEYPREIVFEKELPMTTTGKVIRRLLRERG